MTVHRCYTILCIKFNMKNDTAAHHLIFLSPSPKSRRERQTDRQRKREIGRGRGWRRARTRQNTKRHIIITNTLVFSNMSISVSIQCEANSCFCCFSAYPYHDALCTISKVFGLVAFSEYSIFNASRACANTCFSIHNQIRRS